jgi:hypothetical protein
VRFACQSCGRTYIVAQELAGLAFKMKCKTCGHVIAVRPAAPPRAQVKIPAAPVPAAPVPAAPVPAAPVPAAPVPAAPVPEAAAAPAAPAAPAPAEARAARAPREAERPEAAARPAEPAPPRPRYRRMQSPKLHRPTFVLGAILAVLVAVYLFMNRDPDAKPAQRPVATPVQAAPRPEALALPRQPSSAPEPAPPAPVPQPNPAGRPATAEARPP